MKKQEPSTELLVLLSRQSLTTTGDLAIYKNMVSLISHSLDRTGRLPQQTHCSPRTSLSQVPPENRR